MRKPHVSASASARTLRGWWMSALALTVSLLLPVGGFAQNKQVTGTVYDQSGQPLTGAMVTIPGTQTGAYTDFEGKFTIEAAEGTTLNFSFVGFEEKSAPAKNGMTISLAEMANALDELVVVGYGTVKKSDLTGSVSSMSSRNFIDQPQGNILQGRMAGVAVRDGSVRIRGMNSIYGGNDPLYVVDGHYGGMPDQKDIVSVEVLKDASATAIYGSRGANGVIIVTTRRGAAGKLTVKGSVDLDIYQYTKRLDLLNAAETIDYCDVSNLGDVYGYNFSQATKDEAKVNPTGTNWQELMLNRTGFSRKYRVEISGGTDKARYWVRPYFNKYDATMRNNQGQSYGVTAKTDFDVTKWLYLSAEINAGHSQSTQAGETGVAPNSGSNFMAALLWSPTAHMKDDAGNWVKTDAGTGVMKNPFIYLTNEIENTSNSIQGIGNAKVKILPGLTLNSQVVIGHSNSNSKTYESADFGSENQPYTRQSPSESQSFMVNAFLNYEKTFGKDHNFSAMFGYEEQKSRGEGISVTAKGTNEADKWWHMGTASNRNIGNSYSNSSMRSYFGRVNYNYKNRYYVTGNIRADGSSSYSKANRWGYFPSFALAWRLSEESFMKNQDFFQNIKVRGGWGQTGNALGGYQTYAMMKNRAFTYGTDTSYPATYPYISGNPELKWETTAQTNVGIDLSFLDRFTLSVDWYKKKTTDLLGPITAPPYAGADDQYGADHTTGNVGSTRNSGFDFALDVLAVNHKNFSYDFTISGSYNKNKVLSLGESDILYGSTYGSAMGDISVFALIPGKPIGSMYGYHYVGIWQENEAEKAKGFGALPGDYKYEDVNDDGKYGDEDLQVIGNCNPKFTFGFNNHFKYKNWDLNILFEGMGKRDMLNATYMMLSERTRVRLKDGMDKWTPSHTNAKFARVGSSDGNCARSDRHIQNAAYLKLRNLALGYTFPRSLVPFGDLKLAVSAYNLLTITGYKGFDPEVSSNKGVSDLNGGMDFYHFQNPVHVNIGIYLTL